ncbi:MAG: hypothetical protein JST81_10750 [Bacteroidetes bacterium]|nr:hypothetical protein [Bacteroidota bacterium]
MFIGHFGLGLASKKADPFPSLAVMFIAVQFLDLLWPVFCLLGIERFEIDKGNTALTPINFSYYPYSHSLLMAVIWGIVFGFIYYLFTKRKSSAIFLAILVLSHWVLDLLVHRPDLPLTPFNNYTVGFGLWNAPVIEMILELGLFIGGSILYYTSVKPKRKISYWLLIVFFILIHLANVFGPPPPSVNAVAWAGNLMWIFIVWAWWIERKKN